MTDDEAFTELLAEIPVVSRSIPPPPPAEAPRVISISGGREMRGGRRSWVVRLVDAHNRGGDFPVHAPTESLAIGRAREDFAAAFLPSLPLRY